MTKHIELNVEVNPEWSEYAADVLIEQINCSGVVTEELEYKDEKVIKANNGIVKGYLWFNPDNPPKIEEIQNILLENKNNLIKTGVKSENTGSWNLFIKEIEDEEWAHNWKKFWHPQKIGSKIVICPSWENYEIKDNEIKIELDPGTAFGTGTHPTTRLCIKALEQYINKDDDIADIGTGSGILSIVGIKFGAKNAVGVDNDLSVIEVANENAEKNNIAEKCCFYEGTAKDVKGRFSVVTANILAEVIISIMDDLLMLLNENGKLILSGIIMEKVDLVKQSIVNSGGKVIEVIYEDSWAAIIAE